MTGRTFRAFTVLDTRTPKSPSYSFLIDTTTGQVEEDVAAVRAAEEAASSTKYGKLDPPLYDRLQLMQDDDLITVTLSMTGGVGLDASDISVTAFATLAAQYPEAQAALQRSGKPMDVPDPTLAAHLDREYQHIAATLVTARRLPLMEPRERLAQELQAQGIVIQPQEGNDVLTKQQIFLIAQREDVARIWLAATGEQVLQTAALAPQPSSIGQSTAGLSSAMYDYWPVMASALLPTIVLILLITRNRKKKAQAETVDHFPQGGAL